MVIKMLHTYVSHIMYMYIYIYICIHVYMYTHSHNISTCILAAYINIPLFRGCDFVTSKTGNFWYPLLDPSFDMSFQLLTVECS